MSGHTDGSSSNSALGGSKNLFSSNLLWSLPDMAASRRPLAGKREVAAYKPAPDKIKADTA
jgi:hypothetical protein